MNQTFKRQAPGSRYVKLVALGNKLRVEGEVTRKCPESDITWILDEIFGYANIACHRAKATLPNGENAHCTARPVEWWKPVIERAAAKRPGVRYRFVLENKVQFLFLKKRLRTIVEG